MSEQQEMNLTEFKPGDIVVLKPYSSKMVIGRIVDTVATCFWHQYGTNTPMEINYPLCCLKKVD